VDPHGSDIACNKYAASLGSGTQDFRIGSAIGDDVGTVAEIEGWRAAS
jgi:hypothetical protein